MRSTDFFGTTGGDDKFKLDHVQEMLRKARIQRNHIARAILVWIRLADIARQTKRTLYQVKHGLLDDFLCQQLKNPSMKMRLSIGTSPRGIVCERLLRRCIARLFGRRRYHVGWTPRCRLERVNAGILANAYQPSSSGNSVCLRKVTPAASGASVDTVERGFFGLLAASCIYVCFFHFATVLGVMS